MKRYTTLLGAIYRLYEHSGFTIAGAVAFSFVVSLFPFCIFVGALSGVFGGREFATIAVTELFKILPQAVAQGLAPQVESIMGSTRIDLLTVSGFLALFFATSAIETLRAALNGAYRVQEKRPYPLCLMISMGFVLVSAFSMILLSWVVLFGPAIAAKIEQFEPEWAKQLLDVSWFDKVKRYGFAALVIASQLFAFHLWLAAGKRRVADVWPGVLLSTALWIAIAALYSYYLDLSDYTRFYAGLSQLMIALIFFQFTAIIILLGAELNRGIMELKKLGTNGVLELDDPAENPSPAE
ncbi:MAG: YihY/virulence factor BrkB family protein [Hyphomicrobium sp.]|nr:YihY/virulence factor BrkB family protein [Hyphomicrobium sp.]